MEAQEVKDILTLTKVAELYNIPLRKAEGYINCPFCNGSIKMKVTRDRYFHCYRCEAKGDIFNLLVHKGVARNFREAFEILCQHVEGSPLTAEFFRRVTGLEKVFQSYCQIARANSSILVEFCKSRGWLEQIPPIGLATSKSCLRDNLYLTDLELADLNFLNERGEEYFDNHLVFPIYNETGKLIHIQGRALDNRDLRWKATKGKPAIDNYFYNGGILFNSTPQLESLVVCEGISDTISLLQLGISAIGIFGVNTPLVQYQKYFQKFNQVIFILDNDTFSVGHPREGESKSWQSMLPHVVELAQEIRKPIYYLMPPQGYSGIKDVNEWLQHIDYDQQEYLDYQTKYLKSINELAISSWGEKRTEHPTLWKLLATTQDYTLAQKFLVTSCPDSSQYLQYLLDIHTPSTTSP